MTTFPSVLVSRARASSRRGVGTRVSARKTSVIWARTGMSAALLHVIISATL